MSPLIVAYVAEILAVAASALMISMLYGVLRRRQMDRGRAERTEERIRRLTTSLREAMQLIEEIENEIKARHTLAERLQSDIETYDRLVKLKRPEVEAVAQLLRGELEVESRRSFWQNVAVNSVFFVLGAIVSAILTRML